MSPSSAPTTTMLWASWAIVEAIAPCCEAEAAHEAEADAARGEVALDDRDLEEVARRVGHGEAVLDARLVLERLGDDLALDEADHAGRRRPPTGCGSR